MSASTLLVSAALSLLSAAIYGYVGERLLLRRVSAPARNAAIMFAVWWFALGVAAVSTAIAHGLVALGIEDLYLHVAIVHLSLLAIVVGLWGLLYFLLYVYTGRRRWLWTIGVFYVLVYLLFVYLIAWTQPNGLEVTTWNVRLDSDRDPTELEDNTALNIAFILLLLGPQVVATLLYFSLFFRTHDRNQRYRILMVSVSILIWFVGSTIAGAYFQDWDWWQLVRRFLGVAAALVILAGYLPPRWIRQRYGITAIGQEPSHPHAEHHDRA